MIIKKEIDDLADFEAWGGATDTQDKIVEADLGIDFMTALDDSYPDGMTSTELNDLLWFNEEWCYELVGLNSHGVVPVTADEVIGTCKINEAINEEISRFIDTQKRAYGIEYDYDDFEISDCDFESEIQDWLDKNQEDETDPDVLAERWLEDEGYTSIEEAVQNGAPEKDEDVQS